MMCKMHSINVYVTTNGDTCRIVQNLSFTIKTQVRENIFIPDDLHPPIPPGKKKKKEKNVIKAIALYHSTATFQLYSNFILTAAHLIESN